MLQLKTSGWPIPADSQVHRAQAKGLLNCSVGVQTQAGAQFPDTVYAIFIILSPLDLGLTWKNMGIVNIS